MKKEEIRQVINEALTARDRDNNMTAKQIRKRDVVCQFCGKTPESNGRALPVHHIDYDKKNGKPDNLIALCDSCHTKTNTRRICWQDYFTMIEGKSSIDSEGGSDSPDAGVIKGNPADDEDRLKQEDEFDQIVYQVRMVCKVKRSEIGQPSPGQVNTEIEGLLVGKKIGGDDVVVESVETLNGK